MCFTIMHIQNISQCRSSEVGNLDPVHYVPLPALSWDAALHMTEIELQLLSCDNEGLYYLREKWYLSWNHYHYKAIC